MDTSVIIAAASVVGAAAFFGAGLLARGPRALDDVDDLEPDADTFDRTLPRALEPPEEPQTDAGHQDLVPPVPPPSRDAPLEERLHLLAREQACETAALYDEQGLLVAFAGPPPLEEVGAAVGVIAMNAHDASGWGGFGQASLFALEGEQGNVVRCRRVLWNGTTLLLATIRTRASSMTEAEKRVVDAFPELLQS